MGIREALLAQLGKARSAAGAAGNTVREVAAKPAAQIGAGAGLVLAGAADVADTIRNPQPQPQLEPLGQGKYRMTVAPGNDLGDKIIETLSQFGQPTQNEDGSLSFVVNDGIMARTGLSQMFSDQVPAQ
jgi:hypothetical protein